MNWKKFFAALLAVCLAVSCLCTNVFAEGGVLDDSAGSQNPNSVETIPGPGNNQDDDNQDDDIPDPIDVPVPPPPPTPPATTPRGQSARKSGVA